MLEPTLIPLSMEHRLLPFGIEQMGSFGSEPHPHGINGQEMEMADSTAKTNDEATKTAAELQHKADTASRGLESASNSLNTAESQKKETEAAQKTQKENQDTPGITRMQYRGAPLDVPLQGLTIISFAGNGASVRFPRGNLFGAEVNPAYPPYQELWGNQAHCDGPGPVLPSENTRNFIVRPGQRTATIAFWATASLDSEQRQRFPPSFVIHLVRQ